MADRHNFLKQYKLHLACSANAGRYDLEFIYFSDGYAYASDGHILARVPINSMLFLDIPETRALLNDYAIHRDVFIKILAFDDITVGEGYIECECKGHKVVFTLRPQIDLKMPDFESILCPDEDRVPIQGIGINARSLHTLANAIGIQDTVKMKFTAANKTIFVEGMDSFSGVIGVIMPVAIDQTIEGFE